VSVIFVALAIKRGPFISFHFIMSSSSSSDASTSNVGTGGGRDEPSSSALTALLTFSLMTVVLAVLALYWILCRIELHKTLSLPDKLELEEHDEQDDEQEVDIGQHAEEKKSDDIDDKNDANHKNSPSKQQQKKKTRFSSPSSMKINGRHDSNNNDTGDNVIRRRRLDTFTKIVIFGTCIVLTLLTWLLLVRSNANVLLSWLGMSCITVILLKSYIVEEISGGAGRTRRVDRLSAIVTILLFLTMALQLQSYANTQVAHGVIYSGPARIVGYDYSNYESDAADGSTGGRGQQNANPDVVVTRTDLQVAWGGAWGCPNHVTTQCQALVQGALCQADTPEERRRRKQKRKRYSHRRVEQQLQVEQPRQQGQQSRSRSSSLLLQKDTTTTTTTTTQSILLLAPNQNRRLGGGGGGGKNNTNSTDQNAADDKATETEIQEEEEQVGKHIVVACLLQLQFSCANGRKQRPVSHTFCFLYNSFFFPGLDYYYYYPNDSPSRGTSSRGRRSSRRRKGRSQR
jgi:hypothetical protein